jgi:hypothetical protein
MAGGNTGYCTSETSGHGSEEYQGSSSLAVYHLKPTSPSETGQAYYTQVIIDPLFSTQMRLLVIIVVLLQTKQDCAAL